METLPYANGLLCRAKAAYRVASAGRKRRRTSGLGLSSLTTKSERLAETSFAVQYEGSALTDGRMPVRDLAPALLALGEVFTEASLQLHPKGEPVSLEIQATTEGSFVVDLILHGSDLVWDQYSTIAASDAATAIVLLKELIVGGSADPSLFGLIRWLKNRRIEEQVPTEPGHVRLTTAEGDSIEVPVEVAALHKNIRVRRRVQKVVEPLRRNGVESLAFKDDSETVIELGEADIPAYELPETPETELIDDEIELYLEIVSASFKDDNKWRLSDGEKTFWAQIFDDDFWHTVDMGESFSKGDRLHCRVQLLQSLDDEGRLHTERRVMRVLKHIPAHQQLGLEGQDG